MKKTVSVFTRDKYLSRKIYLALVPEYEVICADIFSPTRETLISDILVWNLDEAPIPEGVKAYVLTIGTKGALSRPFSEEMLLAAIRGGEKMSVGTPLVLGEKCARIHGRLIRFTDAEFALLSALAEAGGEFVPREELISRVWGDSTTDGILNVYVHYLREKLEFFGEKIIISSRKYGYKIDKRYLMAGGEKDA